MALSEIDYMTGNHRSHGHPIGKGAQLGPLMAELVGKATGVCGGKGGSMHLADFKVGSLGESGIVGSSIPIATGAALSSKILGTGRVSLAFFGDGAANQGTVLESMNLAAIWNLPVVFVVENNGYAESTSVEYATAVDSYVDRAAGFGLGGVLTKTALGTIAAEGRRVIEIDGEEVTRMSSRERERVMRKFGMLFQGGALFDSLRVWENVAFGPIQSDGMKADEAREVAVAKLGAVGLGREIGELFPSELSGGMQKRVALARAIAREPEIIFFDEPTTGLDPIMADVINDLIVKCVSDLGATAISITHDMASARKIGHRIGMLYEGRLIWQGPVADIDRSGNAHVDQFIHGRAEGPIESVR